MSSTGSVVNDGSSTARRLVRSRSARLVTATVAAGLTVGVALSSTNSAGAVAAASSGPQAQSAGNFLDATLGGNTLDAIAKLKYATAKAPGSASVQNPLDVTALNAINLPLTGALQLPQLLGIKLGAVNQVASANVNGSSYGAAGAVNNSGGVSVGGNNNAYPANATINLNASGLAGNATSVPGLGSLDALGGVTASIGAVSSIASTPKGYGKAGATKYQIASVKLSLGSPLLGQTLGKVLGTVTSAFGGASSALSGVVGGLTGCTLTDPNLSTKAATLTLLGGAVVVDVKNFTLTIDVGALLKLLNLNLNTLPANTDLLGYVLSYLTSSKGLALGLQNAVNSLIDPLQTQFDNCIKAIPAPVSTLLQALSTALKQGQATIEGVVTNLVSQLTSAAGVNPLKPLSDLLGKLLDIGVNVQPNGPSGTYTDPLAATVKQGTPVVSGQTLVRAIEVNVAAGAGSSLPGLGSLPSLPGLPSLFAARPHAAAAAGNTGILTLALANAAAGPSAAPTTPTTSAPPTSTPPTTGAPSTGVPTGVPAGAGSQGGSPVLPLVLVVLTLGLAAGGVGVYRFRGQRLH